MSTMGNDAKSDLLARVEFFQACTEPQLSDIAHLTEDRWIPAGTDLCHQGDFENDVFVIVEGVADVIINGTPVGTTEIGEIVGELSMLGTGRRNATLRVTAPMHVLVLDPARSILSCLPTRRRLAASASTEVKAVPIHSAWGCARRSLGRGDGTL